MKGRAISIQGRFSHFSIKQRRGQTLQTLSEFKLEEKLQVGNKNHLEGQDLFNSIISHIASTGSSYFSTKQAVAYSRIQC